jgi:hypothetical protein
LSDQRVAKKKGKLGSDKEQRMEKIGFVLDVSGARPKNFSRLNRFKIQEGHCDVPKKRHTEEKSDQRVAKKNGTLHP